MPKNLLLGLFMSCISISSIFAQVTTSSIVGLVSDNKNEVLPGATVTAVHTPSGSKYATTTRADGRFSISNVRVGGLTRLK